MENLSWSQDEKSQSYASSQPNEPPPPPYPPQIRVSPGGTAPTYAANAGTSSQWQYQWQGPSTSTPPSNTPRELFAPTPSSSVTVVRSPSPSSGFNKKRDPLNPPPPSFSRPAPPRPPLPPFPPLTLYSKETGLDKGFPILLPRPLYPSANPYEQQNFIHPFSQRDVLEADWTRLLEDIHITAQLSSGQKIVANVIPLAAHASIIGGIFLTRAIKKGQVKKKSEPVADLVDTWNQYFFHMRGLHVIFARGPENISGEFDGPAPDWVHIGSSSHRGHDSSSSDSSSSSSSSSDDEARQYSTRHDRRQARRAAKRERKEERRERRSKRREEKRARRAGRKAEKHERYRLVVVPI